MILDKGICTILRASDGAASGDMPDPSYSVLAHSWYGLPSYSTTPRWVTETRKELRVDLKIRILQCRDVRQYDRVLLRFVTEASEITAADVLYEVVHMWHGQDDDGPTLVSDLSLREVRP